MESACAAAAQSAAIVDSGSTNTSGYRIDVTSEGAGRLTMHPRPGMLVSSQPKDFRLTASMATRFFGDLKAVRDANVAGVPCMKSASFGTTTHVEWNGWKSPDLDCPSKNALLSAVIADVNAIREASGVGALPGIRRGENGPPHVEPSASPSEHAS